jgi:hypothetical protein
LLGGTAAALYGAWPSAVSNFVWAAVGLHTAATRIHARVDTARVGAHIARIIGRARTPFEPLENGGS